MLSPPLLPLVRFLPLSASFQMWIRAFDANFYLGAWSTDRQRRPETPCGSTTNIPSASAPPVRAVRRSSRRRRRHTRYTTRPLFTVSTERTTSRRPSLSISDGCCERHHFCAILNHLALLDRHLLLIEPMSGRTSISSAPNPFALLLSVRPVISTLQFVRRVVPASPSLLQCCCPVREE